MNAPELLWKYAEGQCSAQEKAAVETQLAADARLRDELRLIRELHAVLTNLEPDEPSMRFTQNVMESLPKIYTPAPVEPLVSPVWTKIFWTTVAVCFTSLLFWGKNSGTARLHPVPYVDDISQGLSSILKAVPSEMMGYVVLLLVVVATLLIVDKVLIASRIDLKKFK